MNITAERIGDFPLLLEVMQRLGLPVIIDYYLRRGVSNFPDPEASLLAGILLGVDTGIPQRIQDAFKTTGTSHIIAISGFDIRIM